ncbi:pyridoxal phosphate-dependent transferase [Syncephalis fuscata]|nr:pyridoxal phosphate-dependent transferase [Syncephalis fuscata]
MSTKAPIIEDLSLGRVVPSNNFHSISVSLPTWQDAIGLRTGVADVCNKVKIGYPRFMFHARVLQLAKECMNQHGVDKSTYGCLPFLTRDMPERCRDFTYKDQTAKNGIVAANSIRIEACTFGQYTIHAIIYPIGYEQSAKYFWSLTGCGVCSRFADCCLKEIGINDVDVPLDCNLDLVAASLQPNINEYLPADQADKAKQLIRQRIVDVLHATYNDADDANAEFTRQHPSALTLNEDSVYLYPGGMNVIFHTQRLLGFMNPESETVCFGLPYINTLRILELVGHGCVFFGHGSDKEIDDLEKRLADPTQKQIISILCETPSNPLLHSPNIRRLRAVADKYDIPLLLDTTVGGFSNSQLFPFADAMLVSLTKLFSGDCDVMGGCLIVNTTRSHGARLQHALNVDDGTGRPGYEDTMWWEDAIVLERNCRTFMERDARINHTAEIICDYLRSHPQVEKLYYPKYIDKEMYDSYKSPNGGYGGLFSVLLHTPEAARAFFDALIFPKGPTFGTNFTLACPYGILAHYDIPEWADEVNAPVHLIRLTIGLEEPDYIRAAFDTAFAAIPDDCKALEN